MKEPVFEVSFVGGIDEAARPEIADARASWRRRENVRQNETGGADKRHGFSAQTVARLDGTERQAGRRLFSSKKVPCVIDGSHLDVYSEEAVANVTRSRVPEASFSVRGTATPPTTILSGSATPCDVAYVNGYIVTVHSSDNSSVMTVEDINGSVIRPPELVLSASSSSHTSALAHYSTYVLAFQIENGSSNIRAAYLNTASVATLNAGWVFMGNVITDKLSASTLVSTHQSGSGAADERVVIAYVNSSGGASRLSVRMLDITGVVESTTVNTSSVTPGNLAVEVGDVSNVCWVAWSETTSVKMCGLDADSLSSVVATTATIITLSSGSPAAIGVVSKGDSSGDGRLVVTDGSLDRTHLRGFQISTGAAATDGSQITVPATMLGSRPFMTADRYYALFATAAGSTANASREAILCDFTEDQAWVRPVGNIEPSLSVFPAAFRAHVEGVGASRFVTLLQSVRSAAASASLLVTFDFADRDRWLPVSHAGRTFLGGGVLSSFDGVRVAEVGFLTRPPTPTTTDAGSGSGPNGSYRYVVVHEEVDANGTWAVSSVSDPSASLTVVDNQINVTVYMLGITARQRSLFEVRIAIYRTLAGAEAPYYRLRTFPNVPSALVSVSLADTTTDATLATQPLLMGTGSLPGTGAAQDRRAPPGTKHLVSYNGMLVGAAGSTLHYSGQDVHGEETWFNPIFQVQVSGPGDVTAMAAQDGTLFVWKRDAIYATGGEAPADNGSQGGLGLPRRLAVDIGADQSATCVTSLGIFFVSTRGIELLTRAQTVEYIGERVQETFAAFPIVTAMTFDPESSCVLIELAEYVEEGVVGGDGRTLVFDTRSKGWQSVDRRTGVGPVTDASAQDGTMLWTGSAWRYAWVDINGVVHVEDHSTHLDPGSTWIAKVADSSWVHIAGLQGEQNIDRILLLAEQHTAHDVTLSVYKDYIDSNPETKTFAAATLSTLAREWLDREVIQSTSQALRVVIEDATPSSGSVGTGRGGTWIGLTFSGERQSGVKRTTSAQRGTL